MKKPLQDQKEQFLLLSKGRLIGWGMDDVKNLIKNANKALKENLEAKETVSGPELECLLAYKWFETLHEKGITVELLKQINSIIGHVRYLHVLKHSPNGLPYWRRIANADEINHPQISVAYGVAQLLAVGALEGLKRCQLQTCRRFFIGRPDAKWCSEACGSKHRVTQKRKRDKN